MTIQQILERLGGEQFLRRLVGQIETVAAATEETGSPGKVTLTVKTFKPKEAEQGDHYVGLETRIVATHPSRPARMTGLYVDGQGLHGDDPKQQRMELRAVESDTATVRESDADASVREA